MKIFRNLSIKAKLILIVTIVVTIIIATISTTIAYRIKNNINKHTITIAEETAHNYANTVTHHLEQALTKAVILTDIFKEALTNKDFTLTRHEANYILKKFIERNTSLIGVGVAFEPNAFDEQDEKFVNYDTGHDKTGRFIPYWTRNEKGKGVVDALIGYDAADWYLLPKNRKKTILLEPIFYPVQGQQIMMTSVVVPILDDERNFLGIIGSDIALETLQNLAQEFNVSDFKGAYGSIYSTQGIIIAGQNTHLIGKKITEVGYDSIFLQHFYQAIKTKEHFTLETIDVNDVQLITHAIPIQIGNTNERWLVTTTLPKNILLQRARNMMILIILVGIIGVISIVSILYYIISKMSEPLCLVSRNLETLSNGNLAIAKIPYHAKDEIGNIVRSTEKLKLNFHTIINQIHSISVGNYDLKIKRLSQEDQLTDALLEMTHILRTATEQNERQNWLKTGQTLLNEKMRGEQTPVELAKHVIHFLCRHLDAQIGLFYQYDALDNKMRMLANYAYSQRKDVSNEFALGTGIIGQVALEKEMIMITDIPKDYINIKSGLGTLTPKTLIVIPFLYEEKLKGIIELGFIEEQLYDTKIDFLKQVMPSIAITMNSAELSIAQMNVRDEIND